MPGERDFLSGGGNFDVGPGGAPKLLDCVAYKLCYHKFDQMHTEYGKPAGYDRARQKEIGNKNIKLETMEEAFTSEHWIVRIYKVLPRTTLEPTPAAKKAAKKGGKKNTKRKNVKKSSTSKKTGGPRQQQQSQSVEEEEDVDSDSSTEEVDTEADVVDEANYVGCYVSEGSFKDKIYDGGSTGANYNLALHHAKINNKRYFAVARGGGDG
jgi:dolichyl-diphosphooligosaccharide--protein glycosyltransferase